MPRCPDIDNPDNGRINFALDSTAPFDNGTIATYDCDLGYQPEGGDRERVCVENGFSEIGVWRGTAPVCAGMCSCVISAIQLATCKHAVCIDSRTSSLFLLTTPTRCKDISWYICLISEKRQIMFIPSK